MKTGLFIFFICCFCWSKTNSNSDLVITIHSGEKTSRFIFVKIKDKYAVTLESNQSKIGSTKLSVKSYNEILSDIKSAGVSRLPANQCSRHMITANSKDLKNNMTFGCLDSKNQSTIKWVQIVNTLAMML